MKYILGIYILGGLISFFVIYVKKIDIRWHMRNYKSPPTDLDDRFFDVAGLALVWPIIIAFYAAYNVLDESFRIKILAIVKRILGQIRHKTSENVSNIRQMVVEKMEEDLARPLETRVRFEERIFVDADLDHANLAGYKLAGVRLVRANLQGVNLQGANLLGANLTQANLSGANLSAANLFQANLSGANLQWADLSYADLRNATLNDADLRGADLSNATLTGAKLVMVVWNLSTRGLPDTVKEVNSVYRSD